MLLRLPQKRRGGNMFAHFRRVPYAGSTFLRRSLVSCARQPPSVRVCSTRSLTKGSSYAGMACIAGGYSFVAWVAFKNALYRAECAAKVTASRIEEAWVQQAKQPAPSSMPWQYLWSLLRPYWTLLVGAVFSALIVAWLNITIPGLLGEIVQVVSSCSAGCATSGFVSLIRGPSVRLMSVYSFQGFMTYVYLTLLSSLGERVAADLRVKLFESLIVQDIAFFDDHRTGDLVNRLTTDIQDFKSSFKICVSQGLRSGAQALGCLVSAYLISPDMTKLMVFVVPAMIGVGAAIGSSLRKLSKQAQAQIAKATIVADEALGNIRVVRAFGMEEQEKDLYAREVERARDLNEKLGQGIGVFQGLTNFGLNCLSLGIFFLGGSFVSAGQLGAGDLMSFLVATQTIQRSLGQMSLIYGHYVRGTTAAARVYEFLHSKPNMCVLGGNVIPDEELKGSVEFNCVNFSYPNKLRADELVLRDLSLQLKPGQTVALCGPSGSGKSTIAALLERFYDATRGNVIIDGYDVRSLDPTWLRTNVIGYISQDPVLFATTIKDNIRYGRPSASDEEVMEAARMANAHDFICGFPAGYQTMVGERGVALSGGQKQRITIARALLKDPKILILDEATSALDNESEAVVQQALDKAMEGRTTLVIAHRLSTIRNADVIAVVVRGKLVEMGSHDDLVAKRGLYWQLIDAQSRLSPAAAATLNECKD